jgi:hypothetical protein
MSSFFAIRSPFAEFNPYFFSFFVIERKEGRHFSTLSQIQKERLNELELGKLDHNLILLSYPGGSLLIAPIGTIPGISKSLQSLQSRKPFASSIRTR